VLLVECFFRCGGCFLRGGLGLLFWEEGFLLRGSSALSSDAEVGFRAAKLLLWKNGRAKHQQDYICIRKREKLVLSRN
jgi:hypothetical protein